MYLLCEVWYVAARSELQAVSLFDDKCNSFIWASDTSASEILDAYFQT